MSDPSYELQVAIVGALKAAGPTDAFLGGRVYDNVPDDKQREQKTGAAFPYVTVGDDQTLGDHAECLEGSVEISTNIHVWSRKPGKVEAKQISGAIVSALNFADIALNGYRLVSIEHRTSHHLIDPDGLTAHSVVTFRALIDEE